MSSDLWMSEQDGKYSASLTLYAQGGLWLDVGREEADSYEYFLFKPDAKGLADAQGLADALLDWIHNQKQINESE